MGRFWLFALLFAALAVPVTQIAAKEKPKTAEEKAAEKAAAKAAEEAAKTTLAKLADYALATAAKEPVDVIIGKNLTITAELVRFYHEKTGNVLFLFPDKAKNVNVVVEFKSPQELTMGTRINVVGAVESLEVFAKELQAPLTLWVKLSVEEKAVKKAKGSSSRSSKGLTFSDLSDYAEAYMSLPKQKREALPVLDGQELADFEETVQSTNSESHALSFVQNLNGWEVTVRTRVPNECIQYDVVSVSGAEVASVSVSRKSPSRPGNILVICNKASLSITKAYPRKNKTTQE